MVFLSSPFQHLVTFAIRFPWEDEFRCRFGDPNISVYQEAVCFPLTGDLGLSLVAITLAPPAPQGRGSPAGPVSESRPLPSLSLLVHYQLIIFYLTGRTSGITLCGSP